MTNTNENYTWLAEFYSALKTDKSNLAVFERLLQDCSNINYQIPCNSSVILYQNEWAGYTALHFAMITKNKLAVDLLLQNKADFTIKCEAGFTALHLYLYKYIYNSKGSLTDPFIDSILSAHISNHNFKNPEWINRITHFHIACIANNAEAVCSFIKAGVSVDDSVYINSTIAPGYTALHFAVKYCSLEVVKILLHHDIDRHPVDVKGISPLHLIIKYKIEIFDAMRKPKSKANSVLSDKYLFHQKELLKINKMIKLLLNEAEYSELLDHTGLTKFIVECTDINNSKIESYIEQIQNVNTALSSDSIWPGWTPLHFAAYFNIDTFKCLLNHGANLVAKDAQGITPLDICLKNHKIRGFNSIFKSCNILSRTLFDDKTKLITAISYLRPGELLTTFLKTINNINIQIPLDSFIWPGYTLLHLALTFAKDAIDHEHIRDNKFLINNIRLCLQNGADITLQDANGMTALHLAFRYQIVDVVYLILNSHYGKIVNPVDCENLSHFHIACAYSDYQLVRQFLRKGVDINNPVKAQIQWITKEKLYAIVETGSTPLHFAVAAKNEKIVKLLLDHDADPCIEDIYDFTPVHFGITKIPVNIVNILLEHPHVKSKNATSAGGLSNLHVACYVNNLAIVEFYLNHGVKIDTSISYINSINDENCSSKLYKRLSYFSEYTPLHFAVEANAVETIQLLLKRDADINAKSAKGLSPLHMALNKDKALDCFMPKVYLDKEIFIDFIGLTALHISCMRLDEDKIEKLLGIGFDPNSQIYSNSPIYAGDTAVHILLKNARDRYKSFKLKENIDFITSFKIKLKNILKIFFKYGANVNIKNIKSLTPVHIAFKDYKEHKDVVEMLLENSKNFEENPTTDEGFSHLHVACIINNPTVVKKFVSEGVDINTRTDFYSNSCAGYTTLHFAILYKCKEVIDLLLLQGADVNVKDSKGSTPLHAIIEYSPLYLDKIDTILKIDTANINKQNLFGKSALELLISSTASNNEKVAKLLVANGARVNDFNPVTSEGLLAIAFNKSIYDSVIKYAPDVSKVDRVNGRDAVHNIVSIRNLDLKDRYKMYAENIENLLKNGSLLDRQDNTGKTALHIAAEFENAFAIKVLLQIGADINITDKKMKVPFDYCYNSSRSGKMFAAHIIKMTIAKLELHQTNKLLLNKISSRFTNNMCKKDLYEKELQKMETILITESLTLRDFLTEEFVRECTMLSKITRQSIFCSLENLNWSEFNYLRCLIKQQYRKVMARTSLFKDAKYSLFIIAKLPNLCSDIVLRHLSNYDLNNLVEASKNCLNPCKRRKIN